MATGVEIVDVIREHTGKDLLPARRCHVYGDPQPGNPIIVGPLWDPDNQEVVMALLKADEDLLVLHPLTGAWNQQLAEYHGWS